MKVIMVDPLVGNDYAACLSSGLSSAGADIDLIVPQNREINFPVSFNVNKWSPSKNPAVSRVKKIGLYFKYLAKLYRHIMSVKPDVVHYQFFRRKSEIFFFLLLKISGVRLIYTAHNVLPHERNLADYYLHKIIYAASGKIIVHSSYIKDKLLESFKINPDKINIIPHGNFDFYLGGKNISKEDAREKLNLNSGDDVVLFFGFIREYKGLDLLLEAFEIAAAKNSRLKLVIAGSAQPVSLKEKYGGEIKRMKAAVKIIFHSRYISVDEVPVYFSSADIVALPYKSIDHSGIIHLAYSFGKPVIATRVGDFTESVLNGETGCLLDTNTPEELAEKINKMFCNKDTLSMMGEFASHLNSTMYSWNEIAIKTLKLYGRNN